MPDGQMGHCVENLFLFSGKIICMYPDVSVVSICIWLYPYLFRCIWMYSYVFNLEQLYPYVFRCICMYPVVSVCIQMYSDVFVCIQFGTVVSGSIRDQYSI